MRVHIRSTQLMGKLKVDSQVRRSIRPCERSFMLALIGIAKSNGVHDGHRSTPPARLDTTHPVTAVFLARLLKITLFIYQQDRRETQIHIGAQCCQCGDLGL